jgi:hypothetical protein
MYTQKDEQQLAKDYLNNESILLFICVLQINIHIYIRFERYKLCVDYKEADLTEFK